MAGEDIWQRACEWLLSDDTGLSSETILRFMLGLLDGDAHAPHDASDFARCLRLLSLFPEWRRRLPEMRAEPVWRPLLKIWNQLEILQAGGHHDEIDRMIAKARRL